MTGSLAARIAEATTSDVDGVWQRHVAAKYAKQALEGHAADGRWGTADGFSVLYLGRPTESVVVEAYRHLVDPVEDERIAMQVRPRVLTTCKLSVGNLLDLRLARNRTLIGISIDELQSSTFDRQAYAKCQVVAAAAHQLGLHGLVTPAATKLGDTLALFMDLLPADQRPTLQSQQTWIELPPDPRQSRRPGLRLVVNDDAGG